MCIWIRKLDIVKMPVPAKLIYGFRIMLVKTAMGSFLTLIKLFKVDLV